MRWSRSGGDCCRWNNVERIYKGYDFKKVWSFLEGIRIIIIITDAIGYRVYHLIRIVGRLIR